MHLQVAATVRTARTPPAPAESKTETAQDLFEDVVEIHRRIIGHAAHLPQAGSPKLVITGAFLRVGKDAVGFINFFEFFLCIRFLAHIRMVLARQFAESRLDIIRGGILHNAEDFIIIAIGCHKIPVYRSNSPMVE